jgi:hypothetical protein
LLPVLGHRLIMKPESEMDGQTIESVVQRIVQAITVIPPKQS